MPSGEIITTRLYDLVERTHSWLGGLNATLRKRSIELVAGVRRTCGGEAVWSGRAARKVGHIVKDILLGER